MDINSHSKRFAALLKHRTRGRNLPFALSRLQLCIHHLTCVVNHVAKLDANLDAKLNANLDANLDAPEQHARSAQMAIVFARASLARGMNEDQCWRITALPTPHLRDLPITDPADLIPLIWAGTIAAELTAHMHDQNLLTQDDIDRLTCALTYACRLLVILDATIKLLAKDSATDDSPTAIDHNTAIVHVDGVLQNLTRHRALAATRRAHHNTLEFISRKRTLAMFKD